MKRIVICCCFVWMLFQSVAIAHNMPEEEMAIGGVGYGCTLGYVKSIYGEPQEKKWIRNGELKYIYSSSFVVIGWRYYPYDQEEDNMAVGGVILSDNSLATPSGFTVGMPYQSVVNAFGEGIDYNKNGVYHYHPKRKRAYSFCFKVNGQGLITEISIQSNL